MRRPAAALALVVALLLAVAVPGLAAAVSAWTDDASASAGLRGHVLAAPAPVRCSAGLTEVTYSWDEVDPGYDYLVQLRRVDNGQVTASRTVTGAATSASFAGIAGLGLSVGSSADLRAEVSSFLATHPAWASATSGKAPVLRVGSFAGMLTLAC